MLQKRVVKEKTKHGGEDNNVMAEALPTHNSANARKVGPQLKGLQGVWFGGRGKRVYFRYPARTSFGRCSVGKASLPKIGNKSVVTT